MTVNPRSIASLILSLSIKLGWREDPRRKRLREIEDARQEILSLGAWLPWVPNGDRAVGVSGGVADGPQFVSTCQITSREDKFLNWSSPQFVSANYCGHYPKHLTADRFAKQASWLCDLCEQFHHLAIHRMKSDDIVEWTMPSLPFTIKKLNELFAERRGRDDPEIKLFAEQVTRRYERYSLMCDVSYIAD